MSSSEWKEFKLQDICMYKTGRLNSNAAVPNGTYPFFTCSPETYRINNYSFDQDAVILAGNNANGVFSIKHFKGKFDAYQRTYVINTVDESIVNNKYLYYYLGLQLNKLKQLSVGSATKFLTKPIIDNIIIKVSGAEEEMKNIANILSSLDEKIEVNNQINKTLESMAQTIFKRWFIDFEFPNENGEPYKSSGGEMIESELGMIPKGWVEKPLYDFANYINGTSFKKDEYSVSGYPIIKIAELKNGITSSTQYFKGVKDEKYYIKNGDILFSWSGNPETSIDTFIWTNGDAILNQHTFKIALIDENYTFIYLLLKFFKPEFTRIASGKQTTGLGHVTVNDLKRLKFQYNKEIILKFCNTVNPILQNYINNLFETQKLTSIRDTLLPKLMSGEIRVPLNNEDEVS